MPGTCARPATEAPSIALSVPKCRSSARLRAGPTPGISCSPASRMSRLRRWRCDSTAKRCASSRSRSTKYSTGARGLRGPRIAQPGDEIQDRAARPEPERLAPGREKRLAPGVAVGTLGDGDHGHVAHAELAQRLARGAELADAAVDQHQIRPGRFGAVTLSNLLVGGPSLSSPRLFPPPLWGRDREGGGGFDVPKNTRPLQPAPHSHDPHPPTH